MDNIFKKGNYLREKDTNLIFQVIVENPTKEDWKKYFFSVDYSLGAMIVKCIDNGGYGWWHKKSEYFQLVKYMNTPLWKILEGNYDKP